MKVKLLKKIRKRYTITHYANGVFICNNFFTGPITILKDTENLFRDVHSYEEKYKAYRELRTELLDWIQLDYGIFRSRLKNLTSEQLWYKK